jgi:hypothetical protein
MRLSVKFTNSGGALSVLGREESRRRINLTKDNMATDSMYERRYACGRSGQLNGQLLGRGEAGVQLDVRSNHCCFYRKRLLSTESITIQSWQADTSSAATDNKEAEIG